MRRTTESLLAIIKQKPVAWARAANRAGPTAGRYTPEPYRSWKALALQVIAFSAHYRELQGEISVTIDIYADRTEIRAQTLEPGDPRRAGTKLTGDIDNYAKAVLDAMQAAGTINDDSQVAELLIRFRPEAGEAE